MVLKFTEYKSLTFLTLIIMYHLNSKLNFDGQKNGVDCGWRGTFN